MLLDGAKCSANARVAWPRGDDDADFSGHQLVESTEILGGHGFLNTEIAEFTEAAAGGAGPRPATGSREAAIRKRRSSMRRLRSQPLSIRLARSASHQPRPPLCSLWTLCLNTQRSPFLTTDLRCH